MQAIPGHLGHPGQGMDHQAQPLRPNFSQAIASGLIHVAPEQEVKKKRGRPRKDAALDGSIPLSPEVQGQKRGRGRPPGSGKKQREALAAAAEAGLVQLPERAGAPPIGITEKKGRGRPAGGAAAPGPPGIAPQIISVAVGEDVHAKIQSYSLPTTRAMVILSASGSLSLVTLKQGTAAGGVLTLDGSFDILSLSGTFLSTDGGRQKFGTLSICLSGEDGSVRGGGVAGVLRAATPVQVLVGSFPATAAKPRKQPKPRAPKQPAAVAAGPSEPVIPVMPVMPGLHAPVPNHATTGIELNS